MDSASTITLGLQDATDRRAGPVNHRYDRGDYRAVTPNAIQPPCIEAMNVVAAQKIDLFGAAGKASLY